MPGTRVGWAIAAVTAVTACGGLPVVNAPSTNQSARVDHLVIHFTGADFAESLRLLTHRTDVPVSAHYLVPAEGDPTYTRRRLRVHRLVDEDRRAWHAGRSYWRGATALNARSIGIEIVNRSRCVARESGAEAQTPESQRCEFVAYDPAQIGLVIELAQQILRRNPGIDPLNVVGHADIAADRRVDPGPTFPWRALHARGIGAWYESDSAMRYLERFAHRQPDLALLQRALGTYGYRVDASGDDDPQTRFVLRAFQMHFRPADWSGRPDAETAAILFALLERYRPAALQGLIAEYESLDASAAETEAVLAPPPTDAGD